jgi:7-cyano-7-deazaguanine reductase
MEKSDFRHLGKKGGVKEKPDLRWLDTFKTPKDVSTVVFSTNEITSLCPITGQPDFATISIFYAPAELCIESKSLKLYLQSYRNEKCFMEELSSRIYNDLKIVLKPTKIRVEIKCTPRGGLTLTACSGDL